MVDYQKLIFYFSHIKFICKVQEKNRVIKTDKLNIQI